MTSPPMQVSRRAFLATSGLVVASTTVAMTVATGAFTTAGAQEPAPIDLRSVQTVHGTPTDIARQRSEPAWARTAEGGVLTYNHQRGAWQPAPNPWSEVLTFGTIVLARWGRPSGRDALLMVFGTAPPSPTTDAQPSPTTDVPATSPTSSAPPTTGGSGPVSPRPVSSGAVSTGTVTSSIAAPRPGGGATTASAGTTAQRTSGTLSYTGFPLVAVTAAAAATLAAGVGLTALARRRNRVAALRDGTAIPPDTTDGEGRFR